MPKTKVISRQSEKLFADVQGDLFEKSYEEKIRAEKNKPVECLGLTFPNDEERRKYFLDKLREKLKDPEFRKIEGFPIGTDEDILALSDPPYYTACPNPFIADFIKHYGKPYDPTTDNYRREPFAADVSEGKNDPIYNAHSYHTKVPHKAIMRYILHYTEPGDIVFDGFCGTGMTGVAAQFCGDKTMIESLGYSVQPDGGITNGNQASFSKLGPRRAILNDLSPAGKGDVPSQIHTHLSTNFKGLRKLSKSSLTLQSKAKDRWDIPDPNKAGDLEKLRERTLLREFQEYKQSKQRKLKVFRLEAVRAGFKKAWQEHDYATIIAVAGKIPETILQEDPKLLMWYDQALTRTGKE